MAWLFSCASRSPEASWDSRAIASFEDTSAFPRVSAALPRSPDTPNGSPRLRELASFLAVPLSWSLFHSKSSAVGTHIGAVVPLPIGLAALWSRPPTGALFARPGGAGDLPGPQGTRPKASREESTHLLHSPTVIPVRRRGPAQSEARRLPTETAMPRGEGAPPRGPNTRPEEALGRRAKNRGGSALRVERGWAPRSRRQSLAGGGALPRRSRARGPPFGL